MSLFEKEEKKKMTVIYGLQIHTHTPGPRLCPLSPCSTAALTIPMEKALAFFMNVFHLYLSVYTYNTELLNQNPPLMYGHQSSCSFYSPQLLK